MNQMNMSDSSNVLTMIEEFIDSMKTFDKINEVEDENGISKLRLLNGERVNLLVELDREVEAQKAVYTNIEQQAHLSGMEKTQEMTRLKGEFSSLNETIEELQSKIRKLETENRSLFDRACKASDNLQLAEKSRRQAEQKTKEVTAKFKSVYSSMGDTESHIETILASNEDLARKNKLMQAEATAKIKELITRVKKECGARVAAEKEAAESRRVISKLESKVHEMADETNELKKIVAELRGGMGLLSTIEKIRSVDTTGRRDRTVGFDSVAKRIESISAQVSAIHK